MGISGANHDQPVHTTKTTKKLLNFDLRAPFWAPDLFADQVYLNRYWISQIIKDRAMLVDCLLETLNFLIAGRGLNFDFSCDMRETGSHGIIQSEKASGVRVAGQTDRDIFEWYILCVRVESIGHILTGGKRR